MTELKFRAYDQGEMITEENSGLNNWQILERYDNVVQWTGEVDKDGQEVYEGHIIKVKGATYNNNDFEGIVIFKDATFCLKRMKQSEPAIKHGYIDLVRFWNDGCHDHYSMEMIAGDPGSITIIGNIHQNPELLNPENAGA